MEESKPTVTPLFEAEIRKIFPLNILKRTPKRRRNRMNNIELDGANTVNTLEAAIIGGSFSMKIGKTRFIVRILGTENDEKTLEAALREACARDILNEARHSNLDHLEKMRKTS